MSILGNGVAAVVSFGQGVFQIPDEVSFALEINNAYPLAITIYGVSVYCPVG